jgi:hypothetical protein
MTDDRWHRKHNRHKMSYPVPRPLFDSIHSSLYVASRAFIRSLAEDVLNVPPSDLLKRVLPTADSFKLVLYDTEEVRQCFAFCACPVNPDLAVRCRRPIMPGDQYCGSHRFDRPSIQLRIEPASTWRPLALGPDDPPLWVRDDGKTVVDVRGIVRGTYNEDSATLMLFSVEEPV